MLQCSLGMPRAVHGAQVAGDEKAFLKGLSVIDDIAYFGIAPHIARASRADLSLTCQLAAVHLLDGRLLWSRKVNIHPYCVAALLCAALTLP